MNIYMFLFLSCCFLCVSFLFYFIIQHLKFKKQMKELTFFGKMWETYKANISEFNSKFFKFKLKPHLIPFLYISFATFFALILLVLTRTFLFFIFVFGFLYYMPGFLINLVKRNRRIKIEKQLISALIFIGNAMKSGLDIVQGLELSLYNLDDPIKEEFETVLKEYHLGSNLEEAFLHMKERIKSTSIDTFVTSIIIQRETGGNVTKIISQIVSSIRETQKLENKVKTLTSQGRIQSIIVGMLPWGLGGVLFAIQPDFMMPLFTTTVGATLLGIMVFWQIIGLVVIKKITTVDV